MNSSQNLKEYYGIKLNTRAIAFMGVMIALEIVMERLVAIPISNTNRVSLGKCVVILAGLWGGPIAGAIVGALSDIIGALMQGYSIAPLITVSSMMWGIIPALCLPLLAKQQKVGKTVTLVVAIIVNSVVSTLILTTLGLMYYYGKELTALIPGRLIQFATLTPAYCVVCVVLYLSPLTKEAKKLLGK